MTCKACGQQHGCNHTDAEYQGVVPPLVRETARQSDFWAKCPECRHVWSVVKLPMPTEAAVRAMIAAFCPACGNDSPTTAAAADIPTTQQDLSMKNIIPADGKFIIHKADPARPRRQHATKEIAEAEAQRLLGRNPADTFVIAQEVARVVPHG